MRIEHTWENEEGTNMAWAVPSQREIAAWKRDGGDIMEHCAAPRGWEFAEDEDEDDTDDGGRPGRYLIRSK